MALAGTLLTASPAAADEPDLYRIGDPAGERFALVGNPILGTRVSMVPIPDPSSWYHLNQQWYFRDAGSGGVNIVNARDFFFFANELCLVPAPFPQGEPWAHGYGCTAGAEQIWELRAVPGGVQVVSQTRDECLTMPAAGAPSQELWLAPCGGPDQVFVFYPVS